MTKASLPHAKQLLSKHLDKIKIVLLFLAGWFAMDLINNNYDSIKRLIKQVFDL